MISKKKNDVQVVFVKLQRKVCAYNEGSRLVDVEAAGNGYAEVAG